LCRLVHKIGATLAFSAGMYKPQYRVDEIVDMVNRIGCKDSELVALDIGAGTGEISKQVANDLKIRVIALDYQRHNLAKYHNIEYVIADAHHLPFKDNSFNLSLIISVLEHFKEPQVAAEEISRVLKIKGSVVLMLPNLEWFIDTATKWPLLCVAPLFVREIVTKSTGFSGYLNFDVNLKNVVKMFLKNNMIFAYKIAYWQGIRKIPSVWPPAWYLLFLKTAAGTKD
jgi:ubiquinone/menaquinone biosynthesis C-methylase UbiE